MSITYCERWWLSKGQPVKPMSERTARQRHESRRPYVALLGGANEPSYVVSVAGEWVAVDFLDQSLRKYLSYSFKEVQPGRLFLNAAYFWEYEADSDSTTSTTIFRFDDNGRIVIAKGNFASGDVVEYEATAPVDGYWESYPPFGEYDSLCTEERVTIRESSPGARNRRVSR